MKLWNWNLDAEITSANTFENKYAGKKTAGIFKAENFCIFPEMSIAVIRLILWFSSILNCSLRSVIGISLDNNAPYKSNI